MSARTGDWQQVGGSGSPTRAPEQGPGLSSEGLANTFILRTCKSLCELLLKAGSTLRVKLQARQAAHAQRSLRVVETVAMGEKRFVAIIEAQETRFLVGGGTAGVSLLARLDAARANEPSFAAVLGEVEGPSSDRLRKAMVEARKEAW